MKKTIMACPATNGGYRTNCSVNPFWPCATEGQWNTSESPIQALAVTTQGDAGFVQAAMNGGGNPGNWSYMRGCPYGMAYCKNPTTDGKACRTKEDWVCVFDPSFLNDDAGAQRKSRDTTTMSSQLHEAQSSLYNLDPSKGPATISVLRPRMGPMNMKASCACTETGLMPPYTKHPANRSGHVCTLDSPCFEDSPGPYGMYSTGSAGPFTAFSCNQGGTCQPIRAGNHYNQNWSKVPSNNGQPEWYYRYGKGCENDQAHVAVGWDPSNDTAFAGVYSTGLSATTGSNPSPGGALRSPNQVRGKPGRSIPNFCGRHKSKTACLYGKEQGQHYVHWNKGKWKNQTNRPDQGNGAFARCRQRSGRGRTGNDKSKFRHLSNDKEQKEYQELEGIEVYFGNNEVCEFASMQNGTSATPNPFLRLHARDPSATMDVDEEAYFPGDMSLMGSSGIHQGSFKHPIDSGRGYLDLVKCGTKKCGEAFCGHNGMLNPRNNKSGERESYMPLGSRGHRHIGLGYTRGDLDNPNGPPDRMPCNRQKEPCTQVYRYYAPIFMGNRGINGQGYGRDHIMPGNADVPAGREGVTGDWWTDNIRDTYRDEANAMHDRFYKPFPYLMRGSLVSATGSPEANGTNQNGESYEGEVISRLDGMDYCANDEKCHEESGVSRLTPVIRCLLDLDRMLGLGDYDHQTGRWTPRQVTYEDRIRVLQGRGHVTGGPEQLPLSEQDLLHLFYTMRLDISLGGQEGVRTACQPLLDICKNVSPQAWGQNSDSGCDSMMGQNQNLFYDRYNDTLGPLVNMCSFAAPHYTDLVTLRANFKTFAALFHPIMHNTVRGIGAVELDDKTLSSFTNEVRDIRSYRMNDLCANADSRAKNAHLGCSLAGIRRASTVKEVRSIADLALWYWATLPDDMKDDLIGGICTMDANGNRITPACQSWQAGAQMQNAYLPECASVNREAHPEYCAMKDTVMRAVDDACWHNPSHVTDESQYYCPPDATGTKRAWKSRSSVYPPCKNTTICIQSINIADVIAGGNVNLNDINMNQCCTTNNGTPTGPGCAANGSDIKTCPMVSDKSDIGGVCDGDIHTEDCTHCVDCEKVLRMPAGDVDLIGACGRHCKGLFPTSNDAMCRANSTLTSAERTMLACKVCAADPTIEGCDLMTGC
jgi:hypothetical protein